MSKVKIKPPKETKAELMYQIEAALWGKFQDHPQQRTEYLLNYFTSADLVGILEDLRRK